MSDEQRQQFTQSGKPGIRFSSDQANSSYRRYEKQVEPGAMAEYLCRQFAADGYQTQAVDLGQDGAVAQIAKVGKIRAVLGLRECLTVKVHVLTTGTFVEIGQAAWVDKVVGLVGGFALTIVPFFTSPFGFYNQHKLRKKAWSLIEHFIGR